jgi:hypothetical protein
MAAMFVKAILPIALNKTPRFRPCFAFSTNFSLQSFFRKMFLFLDEYLPDIAFFRD